MKTGKPIQSKKGQRKTFKNQALGTEKGEPDIEINNKRNAFKDEEALIGMEQSKLYIQTQKKRKMFKNEALEQTKPGIQSKKKRKTSSSNMDYRLEVASLRLKEAEKRVTNLLQQQKSERDNYMRRILELEREQLDAKFRLDNEIQVTNSLRMKEMSTQRKMEEMQAMLDDKLEEQQYLESMNSSLVVKHFESNTELQNARRRLLKGLDDKLTTRTKIGVRRMGAIEMKAFQSIFRERFLNEEADVKAALLCSEWEEHLRNPNWHPFKVVMVNGKEVEMLREDDEKLAALREQYGEVIYKTVTKALLEMNQYNSSGRYVVPELWNFKEDKRASLSEVLDYLLQKLRTSKRR